MSPYYARLNRRLVPPGLESARRNSRKNLNFLLHIGRNPRCSVEPPARNRRSAPTLHLPIHSARGRTLHLSRASGVCRNWSRGIRPVIIPPIYSDELRTRHRECQHREQAASEQAASKAGFGFSSKARNRAMAIKLGAFRNDYGAPLTTDFSAPNKASPTSSTVNIDLAL